MAKNKAKCQQKPVQNADLNTNPKKSVKLAKTTFRVEKTKSSVAIPVGKNIIECIKTKNKVCYSLTILLHIIIIVAKY